MVEASVKSLKISTLEEIFKGKKLLIEGKEPTQDLSYEVLMKSDDLKLIEAGISLEDFASSLSKRNLEMEFRVKNKKT